jgi:hypothetical protein
MAHGKFKPRNEGLAKALMEENRCTRHEDKHNDKAKRSRQKERFKRELKEFDE